MKVHIVEVCFSTVTLCGRQGNATHDAYSVQRIKELRDCGQKLTWSAPETGICKICVKLYIANHVFVKHHKI